MTNCALTNNIKLFESLSNVDIHQNVLGILRDVCTCTLKYVEAEMTFVLID